MKSNQHHLLAKILCHWSPDNARQTCSVGSPWPWTPSFERENCFSVNHESFTKFGNKSLITDLSHFLDKVQRHHNRSNWHHDNDFYRAMHNSAKRGIAIACRPSVRPSVCLCGGCVVCFPVIYATWLFSMHHVCTSVHGSCFWCIVYVLLW